MHVIVQQKKRITAILAFVMIIGFQAVADEIVVSKKVSDWENVTGFDINSEGNYMIVSLRVNERESLYESHFDGTLWSTPTSIESINKFAVEEGNIGGPSLYFDGKTLLFHANFSGGEGGYDIYYSLKQADGWGEPQKMGNIINSPNDEYYPSIPPGAQKLYFSRSNDNPALKKPSRTPGCQTFFVATKGNAGEWQTPMPLHDAVNKGCQLGPNFTKDGKTVFFSSVDQENPKEGYNIYFAREILPGSWLLPVKIDGVATESTNINPRVVGNNIYYLVQNESRRGITGTIYKAPIPEQFMLLNTILTSGKITQLENHHPLQTPLRILDPITLNLLGEFESDKQTGKYDVMLLDNANYMIDVRDKGYSFASYHVDYREKQKKAGPELIELFNEIELDLLVYDSEIFRPLEANVWVEVLSDNNRRISGTKKESGDFSLNLPIGHNYKVCASAKGFEENSFEFNLLGDITFSKFERDLAMVPRKMAFEILIFDADTKALVNAEISFKNLNRDETISFVTSFESEPKEELDRTSHTPKENVYLRESDEYEYKVSGAEGYLFKSEKIKVSQIEGRIINVEISPLKQDVAIVLNNITFATNSADLNSESFIELDRVVELLVTNSGIIIEISAHTDDVGTLPYNMLLSNRRAQSVMNYLLENNVESQRLVSKGYGPSKPMVPNNSEENRAFNRRVEFKIIEMNEKQPTAPADNALQEE